jgi:hypothetical protein
MSRFGGIVTVNGSTACLLPSYRPARAGGGDEDKGRRLAGTV